MFAKSTEMAILPTKARHTLQVYHIHFSMIMGGSDIFSSGTCGKRQRIATFIIIFSRMTNHTAVNILTHN